MSYLYYHASWSFGVFIVWCIQWKGAHDHSIDVDESIGHQPNWKHPPSSILSPFYPTTDSMFQNPHALTQRPMDLFSKRLWSFDQAKKAHQCVDITIQWFSLPSYSSIVGRIGQLVHLSYFLTTLDD
jgi:hypothetical protein